MNVLVLELRAWRDRLLTRESVLLIVAVVLVLTGQVDTMEEAIALGAPFSAFIASAQYRKAQGRASSPH